MFKLINGGEKLPTRATRFSAGFDVYSREDKVIGAGCTELIGLGIAIDLDWLVYEVAGVRIDNGGSITDGDSDKVTKFMEAHYLELHIDDRLAEKGLIAQPKIVNLDCIDELKISTHNPISDCGNEIGDCLYGAGFTPAYRIKKGDKIGQLILKRHEGYLLPQEYTMQN